MTDTTLVQRLREAADEIDRLTAELAEARAHLDWYGENARLARLIHSVGDAGRHALTFDGGKRARAFLSRTADTTLTGREE